MAMRSSNHFSNTALPRPSTEFLSIPQNLLQFLNSMPTTGDVVEWINQFREALRQLLGDVDRIVVCLNSNYNNPIDPSRNKNMLFVTQCWVGKEYQQGASVRAFEGKLVDTPFLDDMRRWNFPFDEYQPPHVFEYWHEERYLGTIGLFRRKNIAPISAKTLSTMDALQRFILFALLDGTSRHVHAQAAPPVFYHFLSEVCRDLELSKHSRELLTLRLLGFRYAEIAVRMSMTPKGVGKRIRSILRKEGLRNPIELFTRRLMPRLEEMMGTTFTPGMRAKGWIDAVELPWDMGEQSSDQVRTITVF